MKTIVFDIGGTAIKYGMFDDGTLSDAAECPTDAQLGAGHVLETVKDIIASSKDYEAIAISTAGQVNSEKGYIIYANSNLPGYTGTQLRSELNSLFHVPVTVENDVNCAAIGEAVYGAGRDYTDFLCLTYGTGVGGAIVHNRGIYHGSSFSAGEFGGIVTHGSVNLSGSTDVFDGCYERFASATALVNRLKQMDATYSNGRIIFENLNRPEVKAAVDDWIDEIILGLVTVTHIFNPPCIVLGGGIMAQPYILGQIRLKLYTKIMPSFAQVKILPASLGNTAGLLGCGYLAQSSSQSAAKLL